MRRKRRKARQTRFAELNREIALEDAMINANLVVIVTDGKNIGGIVDEMMRVPLTQSVFLDFIAGYNPRKPFPLTDDQKDLYRLQMMLNSRYHGKRFDWLGDNPIAAMARKSIAEELWDPQK